jgi:hypothetical protein
VGTTTILRELSQVQIRSKQFDYNSWVTQACFQNRSTKRTQGKRMFEKHMVNCFDCKLEHILIIRGMFFLVACSTRHKGLDAPSFI